jgi:energy-coupling factor transporter ATP-binding protein EcfA2
VRQNEILLYWSLIVRIKTVHVQRFRSIYDATLECDDLTALVGANGAGKSTFLRSLDVFYRPTARSDYYAEDVGEPIRIIVTYVNLSPGEQAALGKYYHHDQLVVEKRVEWVGDKPKQSYHGQMLRHRPFEEQILRKGSWNEKRSAYNALRQLEPYTSLKSVSSEAALLAELNAWELANPGACELLSSSGQFFGFNQSSTEHLERFTRFLLVPAVRDAHADATDERGSLINELIDMVIRKTLAEREEVRELQAEASEKLKQIQDRTEDDLAAVNARLNKTLQQFAPNATVGVNWQRPAINLPLPKVDVTLSEDGYRTAIERSGHGVQRAFIISLLQDLTMRQGDPAQPVPAAPTTVAAPGATSTNNGAAALADEPPARLIPVESTAEQATPIPAPAVVIPAEEHPATMPEAKATTAATETGAEEVALILAIEEPELFQHPSRQRHFARILHDLAHGRISSVARSVQVMYCTHSPLFVDIDRFEQVRVIGKVAADPEKPNQSIIAATSYQKIRDYTVALREQLVEAADRNEFSLPDRFRMRKEVDALW